MIKYLASLALLMTVLPSAFGQHINTDAIRKFWQVVDTLEKDRPLDDSLWNAFYHLPGNEDYMRKNRDPHQVPEFRKYLEWFFRPSLKDSLQVLEATPPVASDDIPDNLMYIKAHEQELRSYSTLVISPSYLRECTRLAKKYIPKNKVLPIPKNLTIYIMAMTFDGATQDSSMYFGLARVFEYDRFRKGSLAAHELHHEMRMDRKIGRKLPPADSAVFSVIDDINSEGSADLIDKMLLLENPGKIFRGANTVHRLMDPAARTIAQLDSCFRVNATAVGHYATGGEFDKIMHYSSGHLPGLFMADIIERNGLKDQLTRHDDDPFQFFYLYNEAARKDPGKPPMFTGAAMDYLRRLDKESL
jgi:hypothetical protein